VTVKNRPASYISISPSSYALRQRVPGLVARRKTFTPVPEGEISVYEFRLSTILRAQGLSCPVAGSTLSSKSTPQSPPPAAKTKPTPFKSWD